MKELFKALAEFQNEVPAIHQNTKGYNYTYADLNQVFDVIKPLLKKHGLGFTQLLQGELLETILFHVESGEHISSNIAIPKVTLKGQNEFQSLGSGISYLRRYSISCLLTLITDKDLDAADKKEDVKPTVKKRPVERKRLELDSKEFKNGIENKASYEKMKEYYFITEEVATEYIKQLS